MAQIEDYVPNICRIKTCVHDEVFDQPLFHKKSETTSMVVF